MVKMANWFERYNAYSYSKHLIFQNCKYRYYLQSIAYADEDNPFQEKIKELKQLQPKIMLEGKILHEIFEQCLSQQILGRDINLQSIHNLLDFKLNKVKFEEITEYYNKSSDDFSLYFIKMKETSHEKLNLFINNTLPNFQGIKILEHEQFRNFNIINTPIIVKIDLVYEQDNKIIIVDWKTGKFNSSYNSPKLQLALYLAYINQQYPNKDDYFANLEYISEGISKPFKFSDDELNNIYEEIRKEWEKMNNLEGKFPKKETDKCISCNFYTICFKKEYEDVR